MTAISNRPALPVFTPSLDHPVTTAQPPARVGGSVRERFESLDLLRGYFVLILASVHLNYLPSVLGLIDGRGQLWVSEAEGFFFISGLLVATMRRRDLERGGLRLATRRSWHRAATLYVLACTLTLLYTLLGRVSVALGWSGAKSGLDVDSSWPRVVLRTLSLHYVYGWADFLTFYAPLFVLAPALVWAMAHRCTWLVLLVSLGLYASLSVVLDFWGAAGAFLQWQVHFVLGAVVGYHLPALRAWFAGRSPAVRSTLMGLALSSAAAVFAAASLLLWNPGWVPQGAWYDELFFDNRLGLLRPLCLLVMMAGGLTALRWARLLPGGVRRLLTLFGQNSLYVYVVQSVIVFLVPFVTPSRGMLFDTALDAACIAALWWLLRHRVLFRLIPR